MDEGLVELWHDVVRLGGRIQKSLEYFGPGFTTDMFEPQDCILFFCYTQMFFFYLDVILSIIFYVKKLVKFYKKWFDKKIAYLLYYYITENK